MENIENGAIPSFFSQALFAVIYLGCWGFLPAENFSSGTARFRKSPQFSVDFRFYCRGLRKLFFSNSSPGASSRAENKKAGQNFYRSDLLKLLVAGTGFEPMTFGL